MENSLSAEDFIGGLLRMNQQFSSSAQLQGQGSMAGKRTDSEAAFQEFLKRIPSATALSGQGNEEKPLFGSTSTNSLLNLAGADVPQGMKQVASLDMLRTLCDTRDPRAAEGLAQLQSQHGAVLSPQPAQLFQASPVQGAAAPAAPPGDADGSAVPSEPAPMGQLPAAAFLAYQHSLQNAAAQPSTAPPVPVPAAPHAADPSTSQRTADPSSQDQQDAPSHSTAGGTSAAPRRASGGTSAAKKAATVSFDDDDGGGTHGGRVDDRRARRMLSNRESARRSRRRKQEQLQVLEEQIAELQRRGAELEEAKAAAQASVQELLAEKGRLENENQHLTSIFTHLQRSLGKETICKHLPPALAGTGAVSGEAAAAPPAAPPTQPVAIADAATADAKAANLSTTAAAGDGQAGAGYAAHSPGAHVGVKRERSPAAGDAAEDGAAGEADTAEGGRRSRRKPARTPLRS